MQSQHLAHSIFERFDVIPTYLVDYPIVSQHRGYEPLRELLQDRKCQIGAQLHPWVTPPFIEQVSVGNSFPGNLPLELEFAKLQTLTRKIEEIFGVASKIYRAGRFGAGPNTGNILAHLGYEADSSVMPCWDFRSQGGPDYRAFSAQPYWIDPQRSILEIPTSAGFVGRLADLGASIRRMQFSVPGEMLRVPSIMSRLRLLERIKLSPEGITVAEAKRLVRHMLAHGHRVFVLSYHSPSLVPGNTPYVRTQRDLREFLAWLEEFMDFFIGEVGGRPASWQEVRSALKNATPSAECAPRTSTPMMQLNRSLP